MASGCPVVSCAPDETWCLADQHLVTEFPVDDLATCARSLDGVLNDAFARGRAQLAAADIRQHHNAAGHAHQVGIILEYISG